MPLLEGVYHTFDLPDGTKVKGVWDHEPVKKHYDLLDVRGKTLLDAGCRDGYFSWLFEKNGAKVTGLDIIDRPMRRLLGKKYGAKFDFLHKNILELAQTPANQWEVVFCSDVLQHLESPLAGLRALHHVCSERLYLVVDNHDELQDKCVMGDDPITPWYWGPEYIHSLLSLAGFRNVRTLAKFQVSGTVYPTRNVAMYQADADRAFTIDKLINGPLWASTCLCDLSKTHRYEEDND